MPVSGSEIWQLPSPRQFLREVETAIWSGKVILTLEASTPEGIEQELMRVFQDDLATHTLVPENRRAPLVQVAELVDSATDLNVLVAREDQIVVIETRGLSEEALSEWTVFLPRFARLRASLDNGLGIIVLAEEDFLGGSFDRIEWSRRLRRTDALIWGEYHVPLGRSELFQDLAVTLAAELCGWRLDLVADLVSQRDEDILAPMGWLGRNSDWVIADEIAYGNRGFPCPIRLMQAGDVREIEQRIWRAQLTSLFPWIEEHRLRVIDRHRSVLRIDDHQLELQVTEVENIELGGLHHQLRRSVPRNELDYIGALRDMRNALAHRKPINPHDFHTALNIAATLR